MLVYPKIAREVLLIRAISILEVYAYLVVAVTLKILVRPCWFIKKWLHILLSILITLWICSGYRYSHTNLTYYHHRAGCQTQSVHIFFF